MDKGREVPEAMLALHQHAQEGLRKCKSIEQNIAELETQGAGGSYFPIVAGKRYKPRIHPPSSSSSATATVAHSTTNVTTSRDSAQRNSGSRCRSEATATPGSQPAAHSTSRGHSKEATATPPPPGSQSTAPRDLSSRGNYGHSSDVTSTPLMSLSSLSDLCATSPSTVQFPDHIAVRFTSTH